MYLERLELVGFKSFASKTVFDFPAGMTAIVLPNGSGKSNDIDAVRWLLGEREAKNVRGAKAEDLIFSGTPARPRMGMAQATIVFNNKNHFFPLSYEEISVRRRISRDGTSQLFLNDAEVRLKDVIDFFAKARLGTKGFSIINQGDSDLFVRSSPKDRRTMLEEILGLRQYELKRHEAEHKLLNTRFNMDKVKALLDEIAPHLRLLTRQTARWEKHAETERELRELEREFFSFKYREIAADYRASDPEIQELERAVKKKEEERRVLEQGLGDVEKNRPKSGVDFGELRKKRNELLNRRADLQKELGRLEVQLELLETKSHGELQAAELVPVVTEARKIVKQALEESELIHIRAFLKVLLAKLDELFKEGGEGTADRRRAFADSTKKLVKELEAIDGDLRTFSEEENRLAAGFGMFNELFKKAYEAVLHKKGEIGVLEQKLNKLRFERERIVLREEELNRQVIQAMRKPEEVKGGDAPPVLDLASVERRMLRLRGELAAIGEIDPALMKEAEETGKRHVFLTTQLEDLEKAAKDLAALIKELSAKIRHEFDESLHAINAEFTKYFHAMFDGGRAKLAGEKPAPPPEAAAAPAEQPQDSVLKEIVRDEQEEETGIDVEISIPRKKIHSLEMLSGGERSLVSLAVLFALISVSPPPFLVLDEADAALDEQNSRRFAELVRQFTKHTQFIVVTHNRATMEAADILYGVTMSDDGTSRVLSLKLEETGEAVEKS